MVFRKGLNDLLSNQARVLSENEITKFLECHTTLRETVKVSTRDP